jgi:hypothetical protein
MSPPSSELNNNPSKKPTSSRQQAELWLTLQPLRTHWLIFNELYGITSQKTELFATPTVRTPNPTQYTVMISSEEKTITNIIITF